MKKMLSVALLAALLSGCDKERNETNAYELNGATSVAEWKGSTPDHFHVGSFKVTGNIKSKPNGSIQDGDFIIPIASIQNFDLTDPVRQQLLDHLKSPDFFNLAMHPNAAFRITRVSAYAARDTIAVRGVNYLLTGDFTMLGQTHPVSFPARIEYTSDSLKAEARFDIDRTKWGMTIYTDTTTKGLYILPKVNMHLKIRAAKLR
jgi:polyisoprenoid-binding protein YceI